MDRTNETIANPVIDWLKSPLGILGSLFVAGLAWLACSVFLSESGASGWIEALVIVLCVASLIVSLARGLPTQNILLATVIIATIGGTVHALTALTGIPFGPVNFPEAAGPQLFDVLPVAIPFVWVAVILASRGTARLIVRPWRKTRRYGYWVIGITTALVVLLDLAMEPFATRVMHYWFWRPTKLAVDWHGTPLTNFIAWIVTTLLILAFTTPALMRKQPGRSPREYYPAVVWILLNLTFIVGAISKQLWTAAALSLTATIAVAVFSIRGAKW